MVVSIDVYWWCCALVALSIGDGGYWWWCVLAVASIDAVEYCWCCVLAMMYIGGGEYWRVLVAVSSGGGEYC